MKKMLSIAAIAILGVSAFSSCSKKNDSPAYSMKATVGGTAFSGANAISVSTGQFIEIEGWSGGATAPTYPYLAIFLENYNKTTGTFNFDSTMTGAYAEYIESLSSIKIAKSGSVTITSTSPNIVGTFSFTCTDGTVVSGGSFTAKSY